MFKRADDKALRGIRTLLGRVIRDIQRKIADSPSLGEAFALPLSLPVRFAISGPKNSA